MIRLLTPVKNLRSKDISVILLENSRFVVNALGGVYIEQEWKRDLGIWVNENDNQSR
ncbi:hypothetical protein DYBT9623_04507 [Dyadobacter sp. CECT 9623]|uniref:Uncharacterized protein n=1 Tax=Dyadobacter linearis TaxID=2823330 RepID=A0ABM8UW00_9BACT|nr:hypothetical protein DYBT9623_04507 [Dyadobacter sp. CECT 9623]